MSVRYSYTDADFWDLTDFKFIRGRPYNEAEFESGARVIVIDEKTSNSIFGTTDVIGKNIELKNKIFRIIGVVKNVDVTMYRIASNVYIPYSCSDTFNSDFMYVNFSRAFILTEKNSDISKINDELHKQLKEFSFENMRGMNRVEASFVRDNYFEQLKVFALIIFHYYGNIDKPVYITAILLFLFFIILPAINLVNININRVYERLSEIGVRKTFGASTGKLVGQFLFENIVITLTGGLMSIILSYLIIALINYTDSLSGVYMQINFIAFFISVASILILGVLSGLLPSINMARSRIVQSLNHSQSK
jgi:putative ABC transport system permease protein